MSEDGRALGYSYCSNATSLVWFHRVLEGPSIKVRVPAFQDILEQESRRGPQRVTMHALERQLFIFK